jgi:hypothetical protein
MGQIDKVIGSKLPKWADRDRALGLKYDTATYMAVVKDNSDPIRSGRLRVWIPDIGGSQEDDKTWTTVSYASPYFGATFVGDSTGNNTFDSTNHTYGMWMVPPDLGNQVLCTFVNGDPDRGYWFACINPTLSHYMVPGLAGGNKVDTTTASAGIKSSILPDGSQTLPVVEFNENEPDAYLSSFYNNKKPIHEPQANILFQQGLDRDPMRGAISSTSQRESPSHVFGISTPGRAFGNDPADDPNYDAKLTSGDIKITDYIVKARMGGHTFVMDDGDVKGKDQLVRLRSATGHQILMNDTEGVMFIINSTGSSWIELEKNGDMNVYNAGSFSVRAQGDVNLHADKNVNINAGSAINLNSGSGINGTSSEITLSGSASTTIFGGKTNIGSGGGMTIGAGSLEIGATGAISIKGSSVALDTGGSNNSSALNLQKTQYPDTSFDTKTRLWSSVPNSASSIVTVLPAHQPWQVSTTPGGSLTTTPTQTIPTTLCPPTMPNGPGDYVLPAPNGNKLDRGKVKGQPAPWSTDTAFLEKTKQVATTLGISNYLWLLAAMYLETIGTMDPAIPNGLGYYGLIQFGGPARQMVGYNPNDITGFTNLTRVQQMDLVQTYFQKNPPWKRSQGRMVDVYACINWPAAVGQVMDYICYGLPGYPAGATYNSTQISAYKNNHFDKTGKNYVNLTDFDTFMQTQLAAVKQCLANAGAVNPAGTLQSGSGITVTDGSGHAINSGTANSATNSNVGISQAGNGSITNKCPTDWLARPTSFKAPQAISTTAPVLTQLYSTNMIAELGYFESQWNYGNVSSDGTHVGKYMVDAQYLATAGYIKPDSITQYGNLTLSKTESWTNKDKIGSQSDFIKNTQVQDTLQDTEFNSNYAKLIANQGIYTSDDICTAAGMLFVAHKYRSADLAAEWRKNGKVKSPPTWVGTAGTAEEYYNHGRYAIDVLSATTTTGTSTAGGVNTTNIDPNAVFAFQQPPSIGTRARFDQCITAFQTAILQAGKEYVDKKGTKIVPNTLYRTNAEQSAFYNAWLEGGGTATNPKVATKQFGTLFMPAKPGTSPHEKGAAIDTGQAEAIAATVDLEKYGLQLVKGDPPHIQLKNIPTGEVLPAAKSISSAGDKLVVLVTGLESAGETYKTGVKDLSQQLNNSGITAQVFSCTDIIGATAYVTTNRGTKKVVLIGFSKGAEIVCQMATGMTVDLLVCIDGFPTVGTTRLANIPKVAQAYNYYNPRNYPAAGFGNPYPTPPALPKVTAIQNDTNHMGIVAAVSGSIISSINAV